MRTLADRIAEAVDNPGSIVGSRGRHSNGEDHDETMARWAARAVMVILARDDDLTEFISGILAEAAQTSISYRGLPNGTGDFQSTIDADSARMACDDAEDQDYFSWLYLLRAATAEALAEDDIAQLRARLQSVAAISVAWMEDLADPDRRTVTTIETKGEIL